MIHTAKKLIIFNLDKRTTIAKGHIHAESDIADNFLNLLNEIIEKVDADPANASLTEEDRKDFLLSEESDTSDDIIIFHQKTNIHTLDEFLRKKR